jgi:predicted NUDIX family NTP pyrophosphohydrolase
MRKSAGILLYRKLKSEVEIFLVHPGGPYWKGKDLGAWTIPKGEFTEEEDPLSAARREFQEETGQTVKGSFHKLNPVKQKGGKMVFAWAVEGDLDPTKITSNSFKQVWPYKSGKWVSFPEVDEAGWFSPEEARQKINAAQVALIDELQHYLSV